MEGSSFEDEFYDVMSSGRLPMNHDEPYAPRKGMSTFLFEEMKKQLEVECKILWSLYSNRLLRYRPGVERFCLRMFLLTLCPPYEMEQ